MTPRNQEHDLQRQGALAFEDGTPRENCPYPADTYQAVEFARGWDAACLQGRNSSGGGPGVGEARFFYNGIKVAGKLHKASYSMGPLVGKNPAPKETITIYGKHYRDLPPVPGLTVENNSDCQSDYFENDSIRVTPDNPHYPAVHAAWEKQQLHRARRSVGGTAV